jgi:hypothetical protein
LGGVQLDEIPTELYSLLGSNDVRSRWFDPPEAFLLTDGVNSWLALGSTIVIHPLLESILAQNYNQVAERGGVVLYRARRGAVNNDMTLRDLEEGDSQTRLEAGNGLVQFDGYFLESAHFDGGDIVLITSMTLLSDPQPVKMFVHLTGPEGQLLSQWDGLGAAWEGWRNGDTLVQVHRLKVPADVPAGKYQLWVGLYDPTSLARWQTPAGDRILLQSFTIP